MYLGLDISTTFTGATILDKTGQIVYNQSWDMRNKNKFPSLYKKADHIKQNLLFLNDQYHIDKVFIEQSLQTFRSGFSSAQTLSTLSRFNGIVSWMCYELFRVDPIMLAASSARKQAGLTIKRGEPAKEKVLEFILDNVPGFLIEYTKHGNPRPGTYDRADSYIIAKAGYLQWSTQKKT